MSQPDVYAQWDAAYVLGALTAAERAEYEEHLAGCARCRGAVAELAGMPGLLGQLSPAEAMAVEAGSGPAPRESAGDEYDVPPPSSLMPVLPLPARRPQWLAPVAAAAAALLIGGVGGYAVSEAGGASPGGVPRSTALANTRLAFSPVQASPMTAVVDIVPTGDGTELRVECQYAQLGAAGATSTAPAATGTVGGAVGPDPSQRYDAFPGIHYAIWVVGRDGSNAQVKDWVARSGRVMHPAGVTKLPVAQISAVEIRQVDTGDTVMRARVS